MESLETLKVYVAGKFNDLKLPQYINEIRNMDNVILTYDWTQNLGINQSDAAKNDINGVLNADVLIAVMEDPNYEYRGTFTELGCALGLDKTVIIVSGVKGVQDSSNITTKCSTNCFYWHPSILHVSDFEKAKKIIKCIVHNLLWKSDSTESIIPPKFIILGPGNHGKDTIADIIGEKTNFRHISSSEMANELFIYDKLKDKYGYQSKKECFGDRRNHRMEWYDLICEYNKDDKCRLTKEILKYHDMYIGIRDDAEFNNIVHLFDLVLWVDASKRVNTQDSTLKIDISVSDIIIQNNASMLELTSKIDSLVRLLGF